MPDVPVPVPARTPLFAIVLIAAPLLEVVEALLSPLANGTTAQDIASIAAAPGRFGLSVLIGTAGTFLLLPALLGLARRTSGRAPKLALAASISVGLAALTFAAVRATQAAELGLATSLPVAKAAAVMDSITANEIGAPILGLFLVTNLVGIVLLGIALLRSRRVPVGSVVLLFLFPVLDFTLHGELGVAISHLVLTASLAWMAVALLRSKPARRERRRAADAAEARVVPAASV